MLIKGPERVLRALGLRARWPQSEARPSAAGRAAVAQQRGSAQSPA
ncbi:MAG TPA: hypothetical protein VGK45_18230 [Thermoanaerobaculia bacterium]